MAQSGRSNSAEKKATDDFILSSVLSHRTFGLTIAYEQSAHRSARSKISVQWWFRILKDRHSRRYDNKLIPRRPTVWRTTATSVDLGDDSASSSVYSS